MGREPQPVHCAYLVQLRVHFLRQTAQRRCVAHTHTHTHTLTLASTLTSHSFTRCTRLCSAPSYLPPPCPMSDNPVAPTSGVTGGPTSAAAPPPPLPLPTPLPPPHPPVTHVAITAGLHDTAPHAAASAALLDTHARGGSGSAHRTALSLPRAEEASTHAPPSTPPECYLSFPPEWKLLDKAPSSLAEAQQWAVERLPTLRGAAQEHLTLTLTSTSAGSDSPPLLIETEDEFLRTIALAHKKRATALIFTVTSSSAPTNSVPPNSVPLLSMQQADQQGCSNPHVKSLFATAFQPNTEIYQALRDASPAVRARITPAHVEQAEALNGEIKKGEPRCVRYDCGYSTRHVCPYGKQVNHVIIGCAGTWKEGGQDAKVWAHFVFITSKWIRQHQKVSAGTVTCRAAPPRPPLSATAAHPDAAPLCSRASVAETFDADVCCERLTANRSAECGLPTRCR